MYAYVHVCICGIDTHERAQAPPHAKISFWTRAFGSAWKYLGDRVGKIRSIYGDEINECHTVRNISSKPDSKLAKILIMVQRMFLAQMKLKGVANKK